MLNKKNTKKQLVRQPQKKMEKLHAALKKIVQFKKSNFETPNAF